MNNLYQQTFFLEAVRKVKKIGSLNPENAHSVRGDLKSPQAGLSGWALSLIFLLLPGCCKTEKIPTYKQKLYSPLAKERNEAALALARCGSKAGEAVSQLSQLLYDNNVGVQSSAAYALRKIDTKEARAILEKIEKARAERR